MVAGVVCTYVGNLKLFFILGGYLSFCARWVIVLCRHDTQRIHLSAKAHSD